MVPYSSRALSSPCFVSCLVPSELTSPLFFLPFSRTEKNLWTDNVEGLPIELVVSTDAAREAECLIHKIQHIRSTVRCSDYVLSVQMTMR
jgi:hypothetical protein